MHVIELFLTCVHEIPNPLSLSVKFHHCKNNNSMYQLWSLKYGPNCWLKQKNWELLQICKHEWCNDLLRPPSFDLQNLLNFL
jgi:hypothetical protein